MLHLTSRQIVAFRLAREWIDQIKWTIDRNGPSVWYCDPEYRNNSKEWLRVTHPDMLSMHDLMYKCSQRMWPIARNTEIGNHEFIEEINQKNIQYYEEIAHLLPYSFSSY